MQWLLCTLVGVVVLLSSTQAAFNPTVTVKECNQEKISVMLTDSGGGGVIYIQGRGSACKQLTFEFAMEHEFDYAACNLKWEEEFRVVVQKKALYQTGEDRVIPVFCFVDTADISVNAGVDINDKEADAGQNKTVKPHGIMKLYRGGVDVTGGDVKLSDFISMAITLHDNFLADFDIKAKTCFASTIPIVNSDCATDVELFPNFKKPKRASLEAGFGAFRPTDLSGGSVAMAFTCTLQVCRGDCEPSTCPNEDPGWGRKKRSITKRAASAEEEDITIGTTLRIVAESVTVEEENTEDVCMDTLAFIAGLVAATAALVASTTATGIMAKKVLHKEIMLKRAGGFGA